jgi:glycosyltransferase involved in cell wall biosynthesis
VVCFDCGGPGEIVTDQCGIKVYPVSPDQAVYDLSEGLVRLVTDSDLRAKLSRAARDRIEEFTWKKKGTIIRNAYAEIGATLRLKD